MNFFNHRGHGEGTEGTEAKVGYRNPYFHLNLLEEYSFGSNSLRNSVVLPL